VTTPATNGQLQLECDTVVRPLCQLLAQANIQLQAALASAPAMIANITASDPPSSFIDSRGDGVLNLVTVAGLLAIYAAAQSFLNVVSGNGTAQDSANIAAAQPYIIQYCVNLP
jgi:hypothetical protein